MTTGFDARIALTVGVTGHRSLAEADLPSYRRRVEAFFDELCVRYSHTPLCVLSPLAEGADRLVVEVALARNHDVVAVLPLAAREYERDFDERAPAFRALLDLIPPDRIIELPAVSVATGAAARRTDRDAPLRAGRSLRRITLPRAARPVGRRRERVVGRHRRRRELQADRPRTVPVRVRRPSRRPRQRTGRVAEGAPSRRITRGPMPATHPSAPCAGYIPAIGRRPRSRRPVSASTRAMRRRCGGRRPTPDDRGASLVGRRRARPATARPGVATNALRPTASTARSVRSRSRCIRRSRCSLRPGTRSPAQSAPAPCRR